MDTLELALQPPYPREKCRWYDCYEDATHVLPPHPHDAEKTAYFLCSDHATKPWHRPRLENDRYPELEGRPEPQHARAIAVSLIAADRLIEARANLDRAEALTYAGRPAYPSYLARTKQAYTNALHHHNGRARANLIDARAEYTDFYD